jgi:hypothetical protein
MSEADQYSPAFMTVHPDGTVTLEFEGEIIAHGLILDLVTHSDRALVPDTDRVRWVKDSKTGGEIYSFFSDNLIGPDNVATIVGNRREAEDGMAGANGYAYLELDSYDDNSTYLVLYNSGEDATPGSSIDAWQGGGLAAVEVSAWGPFPAAQKTATLLDQDGLTDLPDGPLHLRTKPVPNYFMGGGDGQFTAAELDRVCICSGTTIFNARAVGNHEVTIATPAGMTLAHFVGVATANPLGNFNVTDRGSRRSTATQGLVRFSVATAVTDVRVNWIGIGTQA